MRSSPRLRYVRATRRAEAAAEHGLVARLVAAIRHGLSVPLPPLACHTRFGCIRRYGMITYRVIGGANG